MHKSDTVWKRHQNQLRKCDIVNQSDNYYEKSTEDDEVVHGVDIEPINHDSVESNDNPFARLRVDEPNTSSSSRTSLLIENRPKRIRKSPDRLKY